jgi:hypothetical protein
MWCGSSGGYTGRKKGKGRKILDPFLSKAKNLGALYIEKDKWLKVV